MDYIFASLLRHLDPRLRKILSYDIVCQWWKLLKDRLLLLPPLVRLNVVLNMYRFVVPKMHIHGHTMACQLLYSLNLVPGSGQTDGEGIERPWAMIGGVAASTRNNGPGARADALDFHWTYWNWTKLVGLRQSIKGIVFLGLTSFVAALLRRRLDVARAELAKQEEAFQIFTEQQVERIPEWKAQVDAYEADSTSKNPYEATVKGARELNYFFEAVFNWASGLTEMQVRLRLEEEEEKEASTGVLRVHEVSPSGFITMALDLEEEQ